MESNTTLFYHAQNYTSAKTKHLGEPNYDFVAGTLDFLRKAAM